MARPKSDNPRSEVVTLRFTKDEMVCIDSRRGESTRAEKIREIVQTSCTEPE